MSDTVADAKTAAGNSSEAGDSGERLLASARRSIAAEAGGLAGMSDALSGDLGRAFIDAIRLLRDARGRIIVSGMGKSGHVGRKIASTLASTGTPAIYIHPAEASHGDLGMVTGDDVLVMLSWSGETAELKDLLSYSKRFDVPLIAITAQAGSTLARAASIVLALPAHEEACPNGLAPTTSTTMQLVLGDALAVALLEEKGFTASDFRMFHPGGKLGAALSFVRDIMHSGDKMPLIAMDAPMSDALVVMTEKSFGCIAVTDGDGRLKGVITDGDLRRHMGADLLSRPAASIMTATPVTIAAGELAATALEMVNDAAITALFVVEDGRPVGIVHIHDLLRIGVA